MDTLLAAFLFAVTSTITPGPNNLMIMSSGLNFGIRRSVPHLLGICIGFPVMVVLVGLGFGFIFEQFPFFHEVIKLIGVVYLLYLAGLIATSMPSSTGDKNTKPFNFWQAAFFQWVNPKAWIMASGAIAAYTTMASDMFTQVLIIALLFFLVAFPCVGVWLFCGAGLKQFLQNQTHQRWFNRMMGGLLAMSVLPIIYELILKYLA